VFLQRHSCKLQLQSCLPRCGVKHIHVQDSYQYLLPVETLQYGSTIPSLILFGNVFREHPNRPFSSLSFITTGNTNNVIILTYV